MEEFFTRDKANEGVKIPLFHPDGSATDHWLIVLGIDSDLFRQAEAQSNRRLITAIKDGELDVKKLAEVELKERRSMVASLIVKWSFDKPCTPEEVEKFLEQAPQIQDQVDRLSTKRALFFGKSSNPSTPTPVASSS